MFSRTKNAVLSTVLLMLSFPASSTIINHVALGSDLAGGVLTVQFQSGITRSAGITASGDEGIASIANLFSFSVDGDTFNNLWNLTNLARGDYIIGAMFDLSGSLSLFDDDSSPSTLGSASGRLGANSSVGPAITASNEFAPWLDPINEGDMYLGERITWANNTFGAGVTSSWWDDTDVIPEPSTLLLLTMALPGYMAIRRSRERRMTKSPKLMAA